MEQASFKFKDYKIIEFGFNSSNINGDDIALKIDPEGVFNKSERMFSLTFNFFAFNKADSPDKNFVNCKMTANFQFSEDVIDLENIPTYFYANSIAIVFPYLRAFISSLTIQANLKPMILPTMNLTSLSTPLKKNITITE
jgi:preprotein translocase subunit SecB